MNKNVRNISNSRSRRNIIKRFNNPENLNPESIDKKIDDVFNNDIVIEDSGNYSLSDSLEDDPDKYHMEVGFLIVCTGKYDVFVNPLIESIEKYVLPNNKKFYNIFSDKKIDLSVDNYQILPIDHKPFPYPTLYRFHFFDKYFSEIKGDQLIYIDADTLIKNNIGTEILYPITVTQHCGFVNRMGTFETRKESSAYVDPQECKNYYGGGFYSFSREEFYELMSSCINIIDSDSTKGIVPVWHDESALNKYMTTVKPSRVLSPSYHYPEDIEHIYNSWGGSEKYLCKILLLNKNHKEIRE